MKTFECNGSACKLNEIYKPLQWLTLINCKRNSSDPPCANILFAMFYK